MFKVEIKKPIWNGELRKRCVGIAEFRLQPVMQVDIMYTRKDGTRTFPNPFKVTKAQMLKCPTMVVGGNVKLYVIPVEDMEEIER